MEQYNSYKPKMMKHQVYDNWLKYKKRFKQILQDQDIPQQQNQSPDKKDKVINDEHKQNFQTYLDQTLKIQQNKIITPEDITADQFLLLQQTPSPFMKYHKLVKSDYKQKINNSNDEHNLIYSQRINENINVKESRYKFDYPLIQNQSTSQNSYQIPEIISYDNTPIERSSRKYSSCYETSSYKLQYQKLKNNSPSILMKPVDNPLLLPHIRKITSTYEYNYKPQNLQPHIDLKDQIHKSVMKNIISPRNDQQFQSIYMKNYLHLPQIITSERQFDHKIFKINEPSILKTEREPNFSHKYSVNYTSEQKYEYRTPSVQKEQESYQDQSRRIAQQIIGKKSYSVQK